MEQNKRLKTQFRVTGSESLREAFRKELDKLGFECVGEYNEDHIAIYVHHTYHYNYSKFSTSHVGEIMTLPQDWDKALAAAQDYEEVWPKYARCLKTHYDQYTEDKIYVITSSRGNTFNTEKDDLGSTTNGWSKEFFELVTKEEYDLQENEPKIGDWVLISYEPYNGYYGRVVQIIPANQSTPSYCFNVDIPHNPEGGFNISKSNVRKATPQEIKEATEIKVGDKIIITSYKKESFWYASKVGSVYTVTGNVYNSNGPGYNVEEEDYGIVFEGDCRKATAQEIKEAGSVTVSGYNSEVADGKIKFGCQILSKTTLQELHSIAGHVDIKIGDTDITQHLLTKLISKL